MLYKLFIYWGHVSGYAMMPTLIRYTRVLRNDECVDPGYAPLRSELRRLRVFSRTRFGWSRWMELFKRDELVFMLSFNIVSRIMDYGFAVNYPRYLKELSKTASRINGRGGDPQALATATAAALIFLVLGGILKWLLAATLAVIIPLLAVVWLIPPLRGRNLY